MGKTKKTRIPKKEAFLGAYSQLGNVTAAAKVAGIHYCSHYAWMKNDPDYPARFEEALKEACDWLEAEARRRAVEGTERPVFHNGRQVGTIREYSDALLMFLLKGAMPEKYRERFGVTVQGTVKQTGKVIIEKPHTDP